MKNELVLKSVEPIINKLVLSFVEIVKANNSTKIALTKIDSEMQIAIKKIDQKAGNASNIINVCSESINKVLDDTSLSFDAKTSFISKFTDTMLQTLDRM